MRILKACLALSLCLLFAGIIHAEDWTTNDGKEYKNVRVLSQTPAYVTILHEDGGGQIPLSNLKPDLQQRFHYSPAAAANYLADTAAAVEAESAGAGAGESACRCAGTRGQRGGVLRRIYSVCPRIETSPLPVPLASNDESVPASRLWRPAAYRLRASHGDQRLRLRRLWISGVRSVWLWLWRLRIRRLWLELRICPARLPRRLANAPCHGNRNILSQRKFRADRNPTCLSSPLKSPNSTCFHQLADQSAGVLSHCSDKLSS